MLSLHEEETEPHRGMAAVTREQTSEVGFEGLSEERPRGEKSPGYLKQLDL